MYYIVFSLGRLWLDGRTYRLWGGCRWVGVVGGGDPIEGGRPLPLLLVFGSVAGDF